MKLVFSPDGYPRFHKEVDSIAPSVDFNKAVFDTNCSLSFQLNILIAFVRLWFTCINGKAWWNLEKNYRLLRYHGKSVNLELSPARLFTAFVSNHRESSLQLRAGDQEAIRFRRRFLPFLSTPVTGLAPERMGNGV